jgi:signal transduction histidine kinase
MILIVLLNTLSISLFYYKNQLNEHQDNLLQIRYKNIAAQKRNLQNDVQKIIEMIEYKYNGDKALIQHHHHAIRSWIAALEFDQKKSDYIFVYELIDKQGGDRFAKLLINPNRPDLIDQYLSTDYEDAQGFKFRQQFLKDINLHGESIIKYSYKKINGKLGEKISYLYYYAPLNWIISKGVYVEDIQHDIEQEKKALDIRLKKQINQNLFFLLFFSLLAIIVAYMIGMTILQIISSKDTKVHSTNKALAQLNRELDSRVKKEVEKNKEHEQILMQKSKFIALGEMISLIAHQWRQPISELNAIIVNIKLHYDLGKLNDAMVDKKTQEIEKILEYMSTTIDDFRTFFKPDKQQEDFYFIDSFERVIDITSAMLSEHRIQIEKRIDPTLHITNYQNEFEQVVLNMVTNAKDALDEGAIEHPKITFEVYKEEQIYIKICDNAKGIESSIIDKIFEPYFTTKDENQGTGIGLYMSKIIIEQNMGGKLDVESSAEGTCFIMCFV